MALGRDLLVPHVASWTWLNDAPLYYWVALAFASCSSASSSSTPRRAWRAERSCSRPAGCFNRAAGDWTPPEARRTTAAAALLVFIGSVGLIVHAHEALRSSPASPR